ncbi:hypothetical protein ABKN59_011072 [Abortiporus biennis]
MSAIPLPPSESTSRRTSFGAPSNPLSRPSTGTGLSINTRATSVGSNSPAGYQGVLSNDDIEAVIQMATSSSRPPTNPPRDTRTQLFVGNLPYRVRWQDLKDLFRRAGTVLRADVSLGPDNRSRGYGTVLLATAEDAGRAVDMFNGYEWMTRALEVRPDRMGAAPAQDESASAYNQPQATAFPRLTSSTAAPSPFITPTIMDDDASLAGRSLFVGNLPFHIQWQDLKDLFRLSGGTILRADVALGPDGRSRGFGMVSFATEADAERARVMFNGYEFSGRPLKVHFDKFASSTQSLFSSNPASSLSSTNAIPSPLSLSTPQSPLPHGSLSGLNATASPHLHLQHLHTLHHSHPSVHPASLSGSSYSQQLLLNQHEQYHSQPTLPLGGLGGNPSGRSTDPASYRFNSDSLGSSSQTFRFTSPLSDDQPPPQSRLANARSPHRASSSISTFPFGAPSPVMDLDLPPQSLTRPSTQHYSTSGLGSGSRFGTGIGTFQGVLDDDMSPFEFNLTSGGTSAGRGGTGFNSDDTALEPTLVGRFRSDETQRNAAEDVNKGGSQILGMGSRLQNGTISTAISGQSQMLSRPTSPTSRTAHLQAQDIRPSTSPARSHSPMTERTRSFPLQSINAAPSSSTTQSSSQSYHHQHQHHQHPAHPGPISLPPPQPMSGFPIPPPHTLSPYHHIPISPYMSPLYHPSMTGPPHHPPGIPVGMTPHGLPPITPSMPSFTFLPQPSPGGMGPSHQIDLSILREGAPGLSRRRGSENLGKSREGDGTDNDGSGGGGDSQTEVEGDGQGYPPSQFYPQQQAVTQHPLTMQQLPPYLTHAHAHVMTPYTPFSPGVAMSPGPFWGRPGGGAPGGGSSINPYLNPAVGAPVHVTHPQQRFQQDSGYFPPVTGQYVEYQQGGGEVRSSPSASTGTGRAVEPDSYFPFVPPPNDQDNEGQQNSSAVAKPALASAPNSDPSVNNGSSGTNTNETSGSGTRPGSSRGTSWHTGSGSGSSSQAGESKAIEGLTKTVGELNLASSSVEGLNVRKGDDDACQNLALKQRAYSAGSVDSVGMTGRLGPGRADSDPANSSNGNSLGPTSGSMSAKRKTELEIDVERAKAPVDLVWR